MPNVCLPFLGVLLAFVSLSQCAPTTSPPMQNITIPVPQGTSDHGNPNLVCTPSTWTSVAAFFLANFAAHAATIKSIPGEPILSTLWATVCALVLPASGLVRGLSAIHQRAILGKTPLEMAAKARALCTVVRTSAWKPRDGDVAYRPRIQVSREYEHYVTNKSAPSSEATKETTSLEGVLWKWTQIECLPMEFRNDRLGERQGWLNSLPKSWLRTLKWIEKHRRFLGMIPHSSRTPEFSETPALMVRDQPCFECFVPSSTAFDLFGRTVHGVCHLPPGYALSIVPSEAHVVGLQKDKDVGQEAIETSWFTSFKDTAVAKWRQRGSMTLPEAAPRTSEISSNYNVSKALIAIFQTLYASFTLYQVGGDQLQRYGYAAFGLTVAPYLVMSVINLISSLLTPDYPAVYLVKSEAMEEAKKREGARFKGMVGAIERENSSSDFDDKVTFQVIDDIISIVEVEETSIERKISPRGRIETFGIEIPLRYRHPLGPTEVVMGVNETRDARILKKFGQFNIPCEQRGTSRLSIMIPASAEFDLETRFNGVGQPYQHYLSFFVSTIVLVINGALSRFVPGQSTHGQQAWTMTWLVFGMCSGGLGLITPYFTFYTRLLSSIFFVPSIGGFIVVAQMLMEYGYCTQISGDDL